MGFLMRSDDMDRVVMLAAEDWSLGGDSSFCALSGMVDFDASFTVLDFRVALGAAFNFFDSGFDDVVGACALGASSFVDERVTRLVGIGVDTGSATLCFLGGIMI
jgi:hypothetical protein